LPPREWVVHFDRAGTMVAPDVYLRKVESTID